MSGDPHRDLERLEADLATYALGALDEPEAVALERHIESCDACRARLRWLAPAVDLLAGTVEQRTPPASLRASVIAAVREEAAPAFAAEREPSPAARAARERRRWRDLAGFALRPAVGIATMIVLAVGLGVGYLLGDTESELAAPTFVEAKPGTAGFEDAVSATLERQGDFATLHVQELPAIGRDDVYQVWVRRGGVMEPRGVFVLDRDGSAEAAVPGPLAGGDAVLVTREHRGDPPRPTNPVLLEAPLD